MNTRHMAIALMAAMACGPSLGMAVPLLGSDLASFGVLSATPDATNTGPTTINGNLGVSPALSTPGSGSITFPVPGTTIIVGPLSTAGTAQTQLGNAITNLGNMGPGTPLASDLSLAGTLNPGVYSVGAAALSGALTLNGQGHANAAWVFLISSTLITSSYSVVNLINTGADAGVFWVVGSSATLGTYTSFEGNILAHTSITLNTGATIGCGRALANTGEVTMDTNIIGSGCTDILAGSNGLSGGLTVPTGASGETPTFLPFAPVGAVPEPPTLALLGIGLLGFFAPYLRRPRTGDVLAFRPRLKLALPCCRAAL